MIRSTFNCTMMVTQYLLKSTVLALTFLIATTVQAHETRPAVADVSVDGATVQIEIYATVEAIMAGIDLSQYTDTNDAPQAEAYNALRALSDDALATQFTADWDQLSQGFILQGAGPLELVSVAPEAEPNLELPRDTRLILQATVAAGANAVQFGWVAENGSLVVRSGDIEDAFAVMLKNGDLSPSIDLEGTFDETALSNFWRFIVEGFRHIIPLGIDHILFVLGLFLFSLAWRPLLSQVTAFTLAHTVTLGMATLGVITIPDSQMWAVEALIAASITYVAVENILRPKLGWWRIVVVFGFGLLHGLGFASVLGDLGLSEGRFIASLIAFNIGVEFGQLAVIAVAFVALGLTLGRTAYYRSFVVIPGSLAIGLVGLYWVIERAF